MIQHGTASESAWLGNATPTPARAGDLAGRYGQGVVAIRQCHHPCEQRPGYRVPGLPMVTFAVLAVAETTKVSHMPAWAWPGTAQIIR